MELIMTRVRSVSGSELDVPSEYRDGLATAVSAAIDYGLLIVERSDGNLPPVPRELLAQARLAAATGVNLDDVVRRYVGGYTVFSDLLILAAGEERESVAALRGRLWSLSALFDRVITAVGEEYGREAKERLLSSEGRKLSRLKRLLAGELLDTNEFSYDFGAWHLGLVVSGPDAGRLIAELKETLGARGLVARPDGEKRWAWLGRTREFDRGEIDVLAERSLSNGSQVFIGEPAHGIGGWRRTHRQAQAARSISRRTGDRVLQYGKIALLATIVEDDLLFSSLRDRYLDPLIRDGDPRDDLPETLSAYFAADRKVSSAAAALGVDRHTVSRRLRIAEELLGLPLGLCSTELDAALRLHRFGCA
ncbi:MAG: helix-turn-helix domain-containing protein [Solirubrobacterales bacterium]